MAPSVPNSPRRRSSRFQKLVDIFFKQSGLPFSEVLTAEMIESAFAKHDGLFGLGTN